MQTHTPSPSKKLNLSVGIAGMILVIMGTLLLPGSHQKLFFLVGASLMLLSAALERHVFFVILQSVIVLGSVVALLPVSGLIKHIVPIIISLAAIGYFYRTNQLGDGLTIAGCAGLIAVGLGFAISEPFVYFIGGVLLAIYSYGSFKRGAKIAIVWAILNAVFALTSLVAYVHWLGY